MNTICWISGLLFSLIPWMAMASEAVQLTRLSDDVWLHTSEYAYPGGASYGSNGLVVREGDALTLIDTAWGELKTDQLLAAIKEQIALPVTRALVTHYHGDRAGGIDLLEARGVQVYAHPLTQRLTQEHGLPVPDRVFEGINEIGSVVSFGRLQVVYPGPAHAMDNLLVWLPAEKILFGGCAVRALSATSAGNTRHGDIEAWLLVLEMVAKTYGNASVVVPGHGDTGGIELIRHTVQLVGAAE